MPWGDTGSTPVTGTDPNPEFDTVKAGDIAGGDYSEFREDGTFRSHGEATSWDEVSQPIIGRNLDVSTGRIDYNYTELTVDFAGNVRYPNEPVGVVIQAPHAWDIGVDFRPHIHWIQRASNIPNILIEYKVYNNGYVVPTTFTQKALVASDNLFTYPGSGSFQQITEFNLPEGFASALQISATFDCKIYRDSANESGLFTGVDTYADVFSLKYFDIHFPLDSLGSDQEFVKGE